MSHKPAAIPVVANTHRAFVMVDGYNKDISDAEGEHTYERVTFAKSKHKLIASGSYDFCLEKLLEYGISHRFTGPAGVVRCEEAGNPWSSEWVGIT